MGYIRHHAIIVTATYGDWIERAHSVAHALLTKHRPQDWPLFDHQPLITEVVGPAQNDTRSFAILPDGSKEGWAESDAGDAFRERFVAWLREQAYEDGSSPLKWVEVQYGDENRQTLVLAHSDEARQPIGVQRDDDNPETIGPDWHLGGIPYLP